MSIEKTYWPHSYNVIVHLIIGYADRASLALLERYVYHLGQGLAIDEYYEAGDVYP